MANRFLFSRSKISPRFEVYARMLLGLAVTSFAGCRGNAHPEDPQLMPIQVMLEQQLPPRTPEEKVVLFLDNHGYPILAAQKRGTIVANIRRTDTQAMGPVIARVTFYFDANRKLNTFELQRPVGEPGRR